IGAAVIAFLPAKEKLVLTMNERDDEKKQKEVAQADLSKTKKELATTKVELGTTKADLAKTTGELKTKTTQFMEADTLAKSLTSQLEKAKGERDVAQQELSRWTLLGVTIEEVKKLQVDVRKFAEQRDAYFAETKILQKNNTKLQDELDKFFGKDRIVAMPGLKGKIVAVDPKFDFVVLDVGVEQGAKERGEMLINRNGELIGKIRITAVEANRSIANILPGWKRSDKDIMEGDQVFY
ncbi:MAG: hypothetical protein H7X97_06470, partial [Opitutaceae bacterium]|nr:hypothetical protein [Verrucomicrobiales bacterium]